MFSTPVRLARFYRAALTPYDVSEANLAAISDHLIEANAIGMDSHGLLQIFGYVKSLSTGRIVGTADPTVVTRTAALISIDGHRAPGQRVGLLAMEAAIDLARATGVGLAVAKNSNHFGMAGHYTRIAAQRGFVAFATSDTNVADLAPYGGTQARLGNNPISWGVPTGGVPFVLDIATGVVSGGKVAHNAYLGRAIPEDWGLSATGFPVGSPQDFVVGRSPSHKLGGLALVADLLCGPLLGTASSYFKDKAIHDSDNGTGHLFLTIDPERFAGLADFEREAAECLKACKSSDVAPGVVEILYPGEMEERERAARADSGIPIPDALVGRIEEEFGRDICALL